MTAHLKRLAVIRSTAALLVPGLLAVASLLMPGAAHAAPLTVTVDNVCSDKGDILVSVYIGPGDWLAEKTDGRDREQKAHTGAVVFHYDLPPGVYAAAGYHDANGNGEFDTNLVGWPLEGFAFSNDAHVRFFKPPSFETASFRLPPEGAAITLHLDYWSAC